MSATNGVSENGESAAHHFDNSLQWRVGLLNHAQKYLTAESFGDKVNASGSTLKKKQVWILEQDPAEEIVYLRSHMRKYISTDKYGKVTCDKEYDERGATERWIVEYSREGRWAFRNAVFGAYLGGTDDNMQCSSKTPGASEWWTIQLDIHPQVNLRNLNRKRYARLKDNELQCTEVVPWSDAALILMEFRGGMYALRSSDNRYLHRDGTLVAEASDDTMYMLEIKSGQNSGFAFKDRQGRYLTAVGHTATMKARNTTVGRDEIFTLEDSHPQATVTSILTSKRTTVKQGQDLTSVRDNEQEIESNEIFQIEFDKTTSKWAFRSLSNSYWSVEKSGIQLSNQLNSTGYFDLEWQADGTVMMKTLTGRYVFAMANGSLRVASTDIVKEDEKGAAPEYRFRITLVNRPLLVLKGIHGFVGYRIPGKSELSCNKGSYDPLVLIAGNQSGYYIKGNGTNNKYWCVASDGSLSASSEKPIRFQIQFTGQSQLAIKAPNGCFISGEQNGTFTAKATSIGSASQWEY